MRFLTLLAALASCVLVSCVHTSVAPLASPKGEVVAVSKRGAPHAQLRRSDQVRLIEDLLEGIDKKWVTAKFGEVPPNQQGLVVGAFCVNGTVNLKAGGTKNANLVFVKIVGNRPAEQIDSMMPAVIAKMYANASKSYDLTPISKLKKVR